MYTEESINELTGWETTFTPTELGLINKKEGLCDTCGHSVFTKSITSSIFTDFSEPSYSFKHNYLECCFCYSDRLEKHALCPLCENSYTYSLDDLLDPLVDSDYIFLAKDSFIDPIDIQEGIYKVLDHSFHVSNPDLSKVSFLKPAHSVMPEYQNICKECVETKCYTFKLGITGSRYLETTKGDIIFNPVISDILTKDILNSVSTVFSGNAIGFDIAFENHVYANYPNISVKTIKPEYIKGNSYHNKIAPLKRNDIIVANSDVVIGLSSKETNKGGTSYTIAEAKAQNKEYVHYVCTPEGTIRVIDSNIGKFLEPFSYYLLMERKLQVIL